ncbi:MAG: hypothetical protein NVS1B10_05880 [Candidatus Saccharimonadales bacterium]
MTKLNITLHSLNLAASNPHSRTANFLATLPESFLKGLDPHFLETVELNDHFLAGWAEARAEDMAYLVQVEGSFS